MKTIQIPRRFVLSDWGGTETVVLQTSRELMRSGHEVSIYTSMALSQNTREMIQEIPVSRFPHFYPYLGLGQEKIRQLDYKGGNLFSFSLWRALLRESGVDVYHLHTAKRMGGIVRHVAMKKKRPYVVSLHGGVLDVPKAEAAGWTEPTQGTWEWGKLLGMWVGSRRVLDDASAIICVGEGEKKKMQEMYPQKRVIHLPNGVDPEYFSRGDGEAFRAKYGIPTDRRLILTLGRIDPQKNQLGAVESLRLLPPELNAHLVLIGHVTNEPYAERLRIRIQESGLENRVTFIPGISNRDPMLVNALHAADLFLLPSIHEPFGIVILEAWAAGLPVVASAVGGIPSFVESEVDGLLTSAESNEERAAAVSRLLENSEFANSLAEAGQKKARRQYSWGSVTERLIDLYEEVRREYSVSQ